MASHPSPKLLLAERVSKYVKLVAHETALE